MASPLENPSPKGVGQRHILALAGFFGFVLSYSLRFNLSIAIVTMVSGNTPGSTHKINHSHQKYHPDYMCPHPDALLMANETNLSFLPASLEPSNLEQSNLINLTDFPSNLTITNGSIEEDDTTQGEFDWSETEQGLILGSFFWGYILTQIPGGWLGHRFGGKWPFGMGLLTTGLLAIVSPFAAHYGGMEWLIFLRVMQGFGEGITMPVMHGLLAKWVPPNERGTLTAFVYAGMPFGSALSTIISGYIIHYLGWHSVFYVSGGSTVVWFWIWSYLVYSSPEEHPRITQEELKYIRIAIQGSSELKGGLNANKTPWKKVCKSGPVWAILICQTFESWGLFTIMTELPTYMKTVLHFDIKQNSFMSAFPHLLTWIVSVLVTQIGDYAITNRYLSTSTVRKSCNTLGLWGFSAGLLGVAYSGCDRTITVTLLALAMAVRGGVYGGVLVNLLDIAPNYAGVIMGVINTISSTTGFIAPIVAGMIIDENPSIQQWRLVFLISIGLSFMGNLLFILLGSGEEQAWNRPDEDDINQYEKTLEIPSFHDGHFSTLSGPLTTTAGTLQMTTVITRN